MRRFLDRYSRIIQVKEQLLRQLEIELNRQRQLVTETQQRVESLYEELRDSADDMCSLTETGKVHAVWIALNGAKNLKTQLAVAREALQTATDEFHRKQQEYVRSSSNLEAMKTLRKRELSEHRTREDRARQQELDEMAMTKWSRTEGNDRPGVWQ